MIRMGWIGMVYFAALGGACSPELQPSDPPYDGRCEGGGQAVSYHDAPESLKTPQLEDAVVQYEALAGEWTVDLVCPPGEPPARSLGFAVETRPRGDIQFVTGCRTGWVAVTTCEIGFRGPGFPELSGQSAGLDVLFLPAPGHGACLGQVYPELDNLCGPKELDPSYDPSWSFLALQLAVDSTNAVSGTLIYGFRPHGNSQGGTTQEGYDCRWTNTRKVVP